MVRNSGASARAGEDRCHFEKTALKIPSFTLVDLAVHYDLGKLNPAIAGTQLAVNVTNLLDETYLASCSDHGCGCGCDYGVRRVVFATVKYRW